MDTCLFCQTYKKPLAVVGGIVSENEFCYSYHYSQADDPNYLGHLILTTKRHVTDLGDLTDAEAQAIGFSVAQLSRALKACTGAQKIYLEAYYEVNPHLHLILTARYPETPQQYWRWNIGDWQKAPKGGLQEVAALCDQLRGYLAREDNGIMKQSVLALLGFARQQELKLVASLTDAERNAVGTPDSWSARDFLANVMHWKELETGKLAAAQRGEVPPVWKEMAIIHNINRETFAQYRHQSFEVIEEQGKQVFDAFIAQVNKMSEAELNDPDYYSWQDGERLRNEVLKHGVWYPCDQLTTFSLQNGYRQFAFDLQEALLAAVRASALPAEGVGITIYNLACFYARNGEPEKAIALLPEALRLRPPLIEWSQHDSDFDTLRDNPAFKAIYTEPTLRALAPQIELVSPGDLNTSMRTTIPPIVIDVRGTDEYANGHIPGAMNIPLGQLDNMLSDIPKDRPVVTYCNMHQRGVSRGEQAAARLKEQGYQVRVLDGGFPAWREYAPELT